MKLTCKVVRIRFKNPNFMQQRISCGEVNSTTHLEVEFNSLHVIVRYVFKNQDTTRLNKILLFNREEVLEADCEDSIQELTCLSQS